MKMQKDPEIYLSLLWEALDNVTAKRAAIRMESWEAIHKIVTTETWLDLEDVAPIIGGACVKFLKKGGEEASLICKTLSFLMLGRCSPATAASVFHQVGQAVIRCASNPKCDADTRANSIMTAALGLFFAAENLDSEGACLNTLTTAALAAIDTKPVVGLTAGAGALALSLLLAHPECPNALKSAVLADHSASILSVFRTSCQKASTRVLATVLIAVCYETTQSSDNEKVQGSWWECEDLEEIQEEIANLTMGLSLGISKAKLLPLRPLFKRAAAAIDGNEDSAEVKVRLGVTDFHIESWGEFAAFNAVRTQLGDSVLKDTCYPTVLDGVWETEDHGYVKGSSRLHDATSDEKKKSIKKERKKKILSMQD